MLLSLKELSLSHILAASQYSNLVDGFEFRMARFHYGMADLFRKARELFQKPLIITWKGKLEEDALRFVLSLSADFIDVDYRINNALLEKLKKAFPAVKWILSYHNFDGTDCDLSSRLACMMVKKAHYYKIAVLANCALDAFRLAHFLKTHGDGKLIALSMGEYGVWTRVLAKSLGSCMNYTCLPAQAVAPGQICVDDLCNVYQYKTLHANTNLYALIGSPVSKSYSHITHNEVMRRYNLESVYVKIHMDEKTTEKEVNFLKLLGFKGISVTAPFKTTILPHIDILPETEKEIGAINTLYIKEKIYGLNTDGLAAALLLEREVDLSLCKILILGAGGVARAIAFELIKRGADVYVFNRGKERLATFMKDFAVKEHKEAESYDVVIQAGTYFELDSCDFYCTKVAFEVVSNPVMTDFVLKMKELGCSIIYGYQMFSLQAAMQLSWWFEGALPCIDEIYFQIEKLFGGMRTRRVTKQ